MYFCHLSLVVCTTAVCSELEAAIYVFCMSKNVDYFALFLLMFQSLYQLTADFYNCKMEYTELSP
jgi:hypothetical protein